MTHAFILMCLCLLVGVFGDEVKSVYEGDSVTLHTNLTEIQEDDEIEWRFEEIRIAKIMRSANINRIYDDNDETQRFKDRLKLNNQTGDLTITNITTQHTGNYQLGLHVVTLNTETIKIFNLKAYAPLSVPVITSNKSHCSSLKCSLLCSVLNVKDVSLSWYKGNSLLSIISVSDLNIRLSLPLEVEYQDNNTYSCVLNNPITNQTKHFCLADLCQPCSDVVPSCDSAEAVVILLMVQLAVSALMVMGAVIVLGYDIKSRRDEQKRKSQTPATSDK